MQYWDSKITLILIMQLKTYIEIRQHNFFPPKLFLKIKIFIMQYWEKKLDCTVHCTVYCILCSAYTLYIHSTATVTATVDADIKADIPTGLPTLIGK